MSKVLVVATSRKTRGGITSVIKAHESGSQWQDFNCEWIESHIDGSIFQKLKYFAAGFFTFVRKLHSADIVHIHMAAVERKMPFVFMARIMRKRIIIHLHFPDSATIYDRDKTPRYRWCLLRADKVVVLSKSWEELIRKEWKIMNTQVIYNPCPVVIPPPDYDSSVKTPYILYAGNLSARKGFADLLKAFARVANDMPNWKLLFAGNGDVDGGRRLAKEYNIENKVEFLGWISGDEKDYIFRHASVYCLPSYAEGFPMGVLDAWAYHLPVITTPVGGLKEVLQHGQDALIFDPGDVDALSRCLMDITDERMRIQLSCRARTLSSGLFNVATINHQLAELYASLLKD